MSNKINVRMKYDFSAFKKGEVITVEVKPELPKVYVALNSKGIPLYLPRVTADEVNDGATDSGVTFSGASKEKEEEKATAYAKSLELEAVAQATREKVFGGVPAPDHHEFNADMSDQEQAVLSAINAGQAPPPMSTDGPVSYTSFAPAAGISIEDKQELVRQAKNKKVREKLAYTGTPRLKEGQYWLSDLTGGKVPSSGIDHVITCHCQTYWMQDTGGDGKWYLQIDKNNPWFTDMSSADIPDINWDYMWQADVLECVLIGDKLNARILLSGPPGTGKTTAIKQYAAWTDHPFMRFNGKDGIEQSSFLGYNWLSGGAMEWKDGLLPQGLKLGYIICLDEVFKIPPGIQMSLQTLYESEGTLMLDEKAGSLFEKTVVPTVDARLFCTDNVKGTGDASEMFAATQMQDTSTIDRFGLTCDVPYLAENDEINMLLKKYEGLVSYHSIRQLVQFANMVREGYLTGSLALTMSARGLMAALDMMTTQELPILSALGYAYTNKIGDDTEKQTINQFVKAVF